MNRSITGGCQCGAVRYALSIAPNVYACHCRECQRQSGSAFGMSIPVRRADLTLTGALATWERPAESGARTICSFCPTCGTRIHHASSRSRERVTLKAGTLDDTSVLKPRAHLWTRSKQPWVALDPALPSEATQPGDLRAWREEIMA